MKEIRRLCFHILIVLIIIIISFVIWPDNSNINIIENNQGVIISFDGYKYISVLSNDDYMKAIPSSIYIKNISDYDKNYKLCYKYSKTSTLDINNINISLDNNIYKLSELDRFEDNNYIYFVIDNYDLKSYETDIVTTRIWTDKIEGTVTSTFVAM